MVAAPHLLPPPGTTLVEVIAGRGGPVLLSVPHSGRDYERRLAGALAIWPGKPRTA